MTTLFGGRRLLSEEFSDRAFRVRPSFPTIMTSPQEIKYSARVQGYEVGVI
jgi:hypothetical protein